MKRSKQVILSAYARPNISNVLLKIGTRAQLPVSRGKKFIRAKRAPILNKQTRWRSLPTLAQTPLRDEHPASPPRPEDSSSRIPDAAAGLRLALFPGCMTDRLYPEQGKAVITVLEALGATMVYPPGLHCCGLIPNNSGDVNNAQRMALQTMTSLESIEADYIISPSASCVAMMAQDYLHLFRDDADMLLRAQALSSRIVDFTSFLVDIAKLKPGSLSAPEGSQHTVTYHDSCQGLNALGLNDEPRYLIEEVMGDSIAELEENTMCCGFGGSFSFEYPDVSERLMNRKLNNAEATGAPCVVTDNQGCIMHLRGGADAGHRPLKVRHIAELLAERIQDR